MNLFEILAVLVVLVGLIAGFVGALGDGAWAAVIGAGTGALKGFGLYALGLLSIMAALALGQVYRPTFPRCRSGKCSMPDYRFLSPDMTPAADGGLLARCGCGIVYSRDTSARRVCEVRADGTLAPYMYHRPLGRWRLDRRSAS